MSEGDPADIRNWQRYSARLTTSGRLERNDPARLAKIGVRHVVNLALEDHPEALADEAQLMARHGMAYSHIPVPFDAPERAHVESLRAVLETAEGPVHVHCIMNWRVTAFLYLIEREGGMAEHEARARMQRVWDPFASEHPAAGPWRALLVSIDESLP